MRRASSCCANELAVEVLETDPEGRHLSASLRVPAVLEAVTAAAAGEGGAERRL